MRLIIFVRKLDSHDSRMSFFTKWADAFAAKVEQVDIISWQTSKQEDLPSNATLYELQGSTIHKVLKLQGILFKLLSKADALYCHMNPEYAIASYPLAFMYRVPITQWYAHGAVSFRRRLMEVIAKHIVTSSHKGFRKPWFPKKVHVVGQGIDTSMFKLKKQYSKDLKKLLYVGRISPVKDLETVIQAIRGLSDKEITFSIYGDPAMINDGIYLKNLKQLVERSGLQNRVMFNGGVPYEKLPTIFQNADVLINMSTTGSLDKTVLESMSCGTAVITANDAYVDILQKSHMTEPDNATSLIHAIESFYLEDSFSREKEAKRLRMYVQENHSLEKLITNIVTFL